MFLRVGGPWVPAFLVGLGLGFGACTAGEDPKDTGDDALDGDHDGYAEPADCDDEDATRHPGVPELCDGIDNDCDGVVDDDPEDGVTVYVDGDGDGFGDPETALRACSVTAGWSDAGGDCDDAAADVFPGATEHCDGVDEDCDDQVDEDAVDALTFYADGDGDGHGVADAPVLACALPPGAAVAADDCDDGDAAVYPGAADPCDGLDQDCDGRDGAGLLVPNDHATLAEAIAASEDGGSICVQAGTYAGPVDYNGRSITIAGVGAELVVLDGGGAGPVVRVDDGEVASLAGVTVTGGRAGAGAGIYVGPGTALTLAAVRVVDNVAEGCDAAGGGILVEGSLDATDLTLLGNAALESGSGHCGASGGGLAAIDADVVVDGLTSEDNLVVTADGGGGSLGISGGTLDLHDATFARDGVSTDWYASVDLYGGAVWLDDVAARVTDAAFVDVGVVVTDGATGSVTGGALGVRGGSVAVERTGVEGGGAELSCGSFAYVQGGAIGAREAERVGLADVEIVDTVAVGSSVASFSDVQGGAVYLEVASAVTIDGLRITGAVAAAESGWYASLYGGGLTTYGPVEAAHVWVSDVAARSTGFAFGGGLYVGDDSTWTNLVVAANTLDASDDAFGAGMAVEPYRATTRVENADVVGNVATGTYAGGGGVEVQFATSVELVNVSLVANVVTGTASDGGAAALCVDSSPVSLAYVNAYGNAGSGAFDGVDSAGVLAVDPLYVDRAGATASTWDLTLDAASPLLDAGDPSVSDADGSRSAIGAYGGPGGGGW